MTGKTLAIAALAALTCAGVAQAQPFGRGGSATLYELPNFQGRSVTVRGEVANLANYRFNDIAQSIRLEGSWQLCEKSDFGGRCVEQRGDIADLNSIGMLVKISSLQPVGGYGGGHGADRDDDFGGGGRPGPGPGGGYGRGDRGFEGARAMFFPRPSVRGLDVAAGANGANSFCRNQGLGPAVYYDSSERAPRAIGPEGQFVGPSSVLRDLLCRK